MTDKGTILIVDDTPADLELLVDTLTAQGYQVLPAESGELALASVAARPPELILLDIQMPGLDGFEVCRRLKARPESRDIPIMFISVSGESAKRAAGLKLGAVDYITKPFEREELLARVQTHLELGRLRVRLERQAANLRQANEQLQSELAVRKQAEERLQQSEGRMRAITASTQDAILMMDPEGRISYWNPAAERILGYTSTEALGQNLHDLIAPAHYHQAHHAAFPAYRQTGQGAAMGKTLDLEARRKDGQEISVQLSLSTVQMNDGWHAVGLIRDITARKQAEEECNKMLLWQQGISLIQQSLLAPGPLEDKLRHVADSIVRLFGADFCRIWLIRPGDLCERGCVHAGVQEAPHVCRYRDRCLHLLASSGRYTHIDGNAHRRVPFGAYKIGRIASGEDHKFLTNDVTNDPRVHNHEWARELGLVSFAGYQLRIPGAETLGVLALFAKHPMLPAEDALLDALSSALAQTIQQVQAEEALRRSETKFRTLYDSTSDAVMLLDEKGFFDCNQATLTMFGCSTRDEFCSKHPADVSPPVQPDGTDSLALAKQHIATAMEKGSHHFEWLHKRADTGETFPAEVLLNALELDGKRVLQTVVRDTTERKRATEALRQSEEQFRAMFELASVGIAQADPHTGQWLRVNKKMCEITGYSAGELLQMRVPDITYQEDRQLDREAFERVVRGEAPDYRMEKRYIRKDGALAWVNVNMTIIRDATGQPTRTMAAIEDITERKRTEEASRASQQILEGILNAMPVRVFWKDKNLVYLGCNAAFARDVGFADPKDIIGKDDYQIGSGDQAELYRGDDRQVIETGCSKLLIEEPQTTPEGKTITLLTSKLPLRNAKGEVSGVLGTYMDITERKQAEEALRQRVKLQDQLVHIAAAVPGMIYSLLMRPDGSTRMPYVSGALSEIFDLQPKDVIEDAAPIFSLIHPGDIGHVLATIAESARTLNPWRDDFRVRHTRLGEIWVEGHSVPQREPDGSTLWHGFVQNITKRRQAEEELRRTSGLLLRTGEWAKVGGWELDLRTMQLFWALETCRIHEIDPPVAPALDQAIGFYAPEARPVIRAAVQAAIDSGTPFDLDLPLTTANGRPIWVRAQGSAVMEDNTAVKLVGAFQDITERKRVEEELREKEQLLSESQRLGHIGSWFYDMTSPMRWSEELYRLYGVSPDTFTPTVESLFGLIHPDDRPALQAWMAACAAGEKPCPLEFRILLPDGTIRFIRGDGDAVHDAENRLIHTAGTAQDITERKVAESRLAGLHKQLLDASRQAGMAEIATNVLHNVGNVLNSVNISTGLIVQSVKKSRASSLARVVVLLREHAQDLGEFITNDSRGKHLPAHLAQLAEHLQAEQETNVRELELLRRNVEHIKEIVAMQQSYATFGGVKEMISVVNLVDDSLRMNEDALSRHSVEVVREFANVPPLNVEKHKILQILLNLLRNAKHACQESERADKRLTVRVANGEGRIRISVIDNGVGIPPENLTRIFNHGFTTRKAGHGFGLHSGALAAKEMGGSLTVRSAGPGQGAEFTLELPCNPPNMATFSAPNASANTHEIHANA